MSSARELATSFTPLVISSSRLEFLEQYGVPYAVRSHRPHGGIGQLRGIDGTARLLWPEMQEGCGPLVSASGIPLLAPVLGDAAADALLEEVGVEWSVCARILGTDGEPVGTIRRAKDGSVFIPFDPNLADRVVRTEAYVEALSTQAGGFARDLARSAYYRLRPALPRTAQMAMRRRFARLQDRKMFPRWPAETALHDLHEWLMGLVQMVSGQPIPQIHWWPDGRKWAVVLTHDVEHVPGYRRVRDLMALERERGLRSAWYFVPERDYDVEVSLLEELRDGGFEVAVHGLKHDGRDLTPGVFESRIAAIRAYAAEWGAVGFRGPSTQRGWEQVCRLGLDHDSSYSDVARYEPQSGGSCSWLPFFIGDVVELPITLPMDHTVFDLLEQPDATVWHEKSDLLRSRGGMAILLTHPDYLTAPHRLEAYTAYLDRVSADRGAWCALPREASSWWRDRAASRIEYEDGAWVVTGPAAGRASVVVVDRPPSFGGSRLLDLIGSITLTTLPLAEDLVAVALAPVA